MTSAGASRWAPAPGASAVSRRPTAVTVAVVLSWVGAGVLALFGVIAWLFAGHPQLLAGLQRGSGSPVDRAVTVDRLHVLGPLMLGWALAVLVLALLAWQRHRWAVLGLTAMALGCALVQAYGLFRLGATDESPPVGAVAGPLLALVWVGACTALLWTPSARCWFSSGARGNVPAYERNRW